MCVHSTGQSSLPPDCVAHVGYVEAEIPNNRLHKFVGTLTYNDQQYSLDNDKIVLRVRYIVL